MRLEMTIWCSVLLLNLAPATPDAGAAASVAQEQVPFPSADAQFFADHPDLTDEREVVEAAARELAAEGFQATDDRRALEVLAAKSRELLSRRTPGEWQKKAIGLYPDLGIAGTEMNSLFLRHYRELQESAPAFAKELSWPLLLAKRCADELRARQQASAPQVRTQRPPPAAIDPRPTASSPQRSPSGAGLVLAGAAIIAAAFLPGLLAFRLSPAPVSRDSLAEPRASSPWFRAVKPAAVIYGFAAIAAAVRSLPENADLSLTNRFFITLLVSILFGGCAGVIGYLSALLYCALHPRDVQPGAHFRGGGWHGHC